MLLKMELTEAVLLGFETVVDLYELNPQMTSQILMKL